MSGLLTTCDIYKKNQLNFNRRVIFPWPAQLLELWRSSSRILSWDQIHLSRANSKLMTNLWKLLIRDAALEPLTWLPSSTNHNPIQTHQEKVLDCDGNRKHSKSVDPLLTVSKTARHWILWKELRGGDRLRLKRGEVCFLGHCPSTCYWSQLCSSVQRMFVVCDSGKWLPNGLINN